MHNMALPWAFIGLFSGFWKLVLVAAVTLVLFGRSGLPRHPLLRLLSPRSNAAVRKNQPARQPVPWYSDRWFVFLLFITATAVTAWIVTRMAVITPSSGLR